MSDLQARKFHLDLSIFSGVTACSVGLSEAGTPVYSGLPGESKAGHIRGGNTRQGDYGYLGEKTGLGDFEYPGEKAMVDFWKVVFRLR